MFKPQHGLALGCVRQMALCAVAAFVLLPIVTLGVIAFDGTLNSARILEFRWLPRRFSLEPLRIAWTSPAQNQPFTQFLVNSLLLSGGSAALVLVGGASMAYAFARMRFVGRKLGLFALLVGAFLPPVALMVPLYLLLTSLGIRTTLWGLLATYTAFALPLAIWNMRAAFQAVPRELEEAAFLDGAGPFTTFMQVALPMALPPILVAGLIAFLGAYTEFAMGWLLLNDPERMTLAMALRNMSGYFASAWNMLAAFTLLMCAPVILVFLALQNYLLNGLVVDIASDL